MSKKGLEGLVGKAGALFRKGALLAGTIFSLASPLASQTPSIDLTTTFKNNLLSTNKADSRIKPEFNIKASGVYRLYPEFMNPLYNILRLDGIDFSFINDAQQKYNNLKLDAAIPLLPMFVDMNMFSATKLSYQMFDDDSKPSTNSSSHEKWSRIWINQIISPFAYLGQAGRFIGTSDLTFEAADLKKDTLTSSDTHSWLNIPPVVDLRNYGTNILNIGSKQIAFSIRQGFLPRLFNKLEDISVAYSSLSIDENSPFNGMSGTSYFFITNQGGETRSEGAYNNKSIKDEFRITASTLPLGKDYSVFAAELWLGNVKNDLHQNSTLKPVSFILGPLQEVRRAITNKEDYSFTKASALLTSDSLIKQIAFVYFENKMTSGDGAIHDDDPGLFVGDWDTMAQGSSTGLMASLDMFLFKALNVMFSVSSANENFSKTIPHASSPNTNIHIYNVPAGMMDGYCDRDGNISASKKNILSLSALFSLVPTRSDAAMIGQSYMMVCNSAIDSSIREMIKSSHIYPTPSSGSKAWEIVRMGFTYTKYDEYRKQILTISSNKGETFAIALGFMPSKSIGFTYMFTDDVLKSFQHDFGITYRIEGFNNSIFNNISFDIAFALKNYEKGYASSRGLQDTSSLNLSMKAGLLDQPQMINKRRIQAELPGLEKNVELETRRLFSRLKALEDGSVLLHYGHKNETFLHIANTLQHCKDINFELANYYGRLKSIASADIELSKIDTENVTNALQEVKKNTALLNNAYFNSIGKHLVVDINNDPDLGDFIVMQLGTKVMKLDGKAWNNEQHIILANSSIDTILPFEAYTTIGPDAVAIYNLNKIDDYTSGLKQRVSGLSKGYIKQVARGKAYNSDLTQTEVDSLVNMFALLLNNKKGLSTYGLIKSRTKHEQWHLDGNLDETGAIMNEIIDGNTYFALISLLNYKGSAARQYDAAFKEIYSAFSEFGHLHGDRYGLNKNQNILGQFAALCQKDEKSAGRYIEDFKEYLNSIRQSKTKD